MTIQSVIPNRLISTASGLAEGMRDIKNQGELKGAALAHAAANAPEKAGRVAAAVGEFFTGQLPGIFSSAKSAVLSRFTPKTDQVPSKADEPKPLPERRTIDRQKPANDADLKKVYVGLEDEARDNPNMSTFSRSNQLPHSATIAKCMDDLAVNFALDTYARMPEDKLIVFSKMHYDEAVTGFKTVDGQPLITKENQDEIAARSASFLRSTLEKIFGGSETAAKEAGRNLPQEMKDILATGLKAIDDSNLDDKETAKQRFAADVVLRGYSPKLAGFPGGTQICRQSMKEVAKVVQNIANQGIASTKKNPLHEGVLTFLEDVSGMRDNMLTMIQAAAEQGTAYVPEERAGSALESVSDQAEIVRREPRSLGEAFIGLHRRELST